jgi:hypothetical protein
MKLLHLCSFFLACSAMGQAVDFRNNQTDFPTPADRDVYFPDYSTPLGSSFGYVGTNFQARLLYGSNASSLQPATYVTPARFRNVTGGVALAGTWTGGNRTLAGFTFGDTVTLVVQVWDAGPDRVGGVPGRTFDDARATGLFWGESAPFTYTIAPPGSATTAFYMNNFRSWGMVPEPSVFALGVVGFIAMVLLKNRRNSIRNS